VNENCRCVNASEMNIKDLLIKLIKVFAVKCITLTSGHITKLMADLMHLMFTHCLGACNMHMRKGKIPTD
jgi:hypothetical protein